MKNKKIVLMFHDVYEQNPYESGFTRETSNLFKINRKDFLHFLNLLELKLQQIKLPKSEVVFTFDDGGSSSLWIAETLFERGFIGCFFVITSLIGTKGFCTADDCGKIAARGHIVGSHSHTHPALINSLSKEELRKEWVTSIEQLEEIINIPIESVSIPNGFYSKAIGHLLHDLGMKEIYTSAPIKSFSTIGIMRVIGRFTIRCDSPIESYLKYFDRFSWFVFKIQIRWFILQVMKKIFGKFFLKVRQFYYNKTKQ